MKPLLIAPLAAVVALTIAPAVSIAAPPPAVAARQDASAEDVYNFMALCMAADILASQTAPASQQRTEDGTLVYTMLMRAGALVGKSEDDMVEDVAGLAAMWQGDAEAMRESPPETIRVQCVQTIRDSGVA